MLQNLSSAAVVIGAVRKFFMLCGLLIFFKITFFQNPSGIPSECQTEWIQIRGGQIFGPDLGPDYKQTTLVGNMAIAE